MGWVIHARFFLFVGLLCLSHLCSLIRLGLLCLLMWKSDTSSIPAFLLPRDINGLVKHNRRPRAVREREVEQTKMAWFWNTLDRVTGGGDGVRNSTSANDEMCELLFLNEPDAYQSSMGAQSRNRHTHTQTQAQTSQQQTHATEPEPLLNDSDAQAPARTSIPRSHRPSTAVQFARTLRSLSQAARPRQASHAPMPSASPSPEASLLQPARDEFFVLPAEPPANLTPEQVRGDVN
jgi:hypothetical protein